MTPAAVPPAGPRPITLTEHFASFDEMCWPRASESIGEVEWELRHGEPTREDLMVAASVLAAYRQMVWDPRVKRDAIIRRLREAETMEADP